MLNVPSKKSVWRARQNAFNLHSLSGLSCDEVVDQLTEFLTYQQGETDKVRYALSLALSEALEGLTTFDENHVPTEIIVKMMVCYLTNCIFQQIEYDTDKDYMQRHDPIGFVEAENDVRQAIFETVEMLLSPKFARVVALFQ